MNLGSAEVIVLFALVVATIVPLWGLIRAAIDRNTGWTVALGVGLFLPFVGFILAIVYLVGVRPRRGDRRGPPPPPPAAA